MRRSTNPESNTFQPFNITQPMKSIQESTTDYFHKMHQIYKHINHCENTSTPIKRKDLEFYLQSCTSPKGGKKGCAAEAITIMTRNGIIQNTNKSFYAVKVKNLDAAIAHAAEELAIAKRSRSKKQPKKQDIVQPTLFTESVMREQERPIVTANDQLIQRIEALEARLNKITTLFQNL